MAYHAFEYLRILTENNKNSKNGGSIRKRAKKIKKKNAGNKIEFVFCPIRGYQQLNT